MSNCLSFKDQMRECTLKCKVIYRWLLDCHLALGKLGVMTGRLSFARWRGTSGTGWGSRACVFRGAHWRSGSPLPGRAPGRGDFAAGAWWWRCPGASGLPRRGLTCCFSEVRSWVRGPSQLPVTLPQSPTALGPRCTWGVPNAGAPAPRAFAARRGPRSASPVAAATAWPPRSLASCGRRAGWARESSDLGSLGGRVQAGTLQRHPSVPRTRCRSFSNCPVASSQLPAPRHRTWKGRAEMFYLPRLLF